jgi:hypothetical protein
VELRRIDIPGPRDGGNPALVIFQMRPGEVRAEPVGRRGAFVVQLRAIEPVQAESRPEERRAVGAQLSQAAEAELFESFVAAAEREVGTERYAEQIAAVRNRLAGVTTP